MDVSGIIGGGEAGTYLRHKKRKKATSRATMEMQ